MKHISLNLSERELEVLQDALQQMREYESARYVKVVQEYGQSEEALNLLIRSKAIQEVQKQVSDGETDRQDITPMSVREARQLIDVITEGKYQLGKKRIALHEDGYKEEAIYYALCEDLATRVLLKLAYRERVLMRTGNKGEEQ